MTDHYAEKRQTLRREIKEELEKILPDLVAAQLEMLLKMLQALSK